MIVLSALFLAPTDTIPYYKNELCDPIFCPKMEIAILDI